MKPSGQNPRFSEQIKKIQETVTNAKRDYSWNAEEVNRLDKLTQDYLHMLELENLDYRERAKIATKIAKCRRLRRASKDTAETLQPFIAFIESDKGRALMNLLSEALGQTRKVEEKMKNRTYRYKVLDDT